MKKYNSTRDKERLLKKEEQLSIEDINLFIELFERFPKSYFYLSPIRQKEVCSKISGAISFLSQEENILPERLEKRLKFLFDEMENRLLRVIYQNNED